MKLTLGKTKYQKFESIAVLVLIFVGLAVFAFFKLVESGAVTPGEETKQYVAEYIKTSSLHKVSCSWSGYVKHKNTGLQQIFVACTPQEKLPVEVKNESELHKAIDQYVISPAIEALPMENDLSIVAITRIDQSSVICTDIIKRKIVRQWADSYDNYCWPK